MGFPIGVKFIGVDLVSKTSRQSTSFDWSADAMPSWKTGKQNTLIHECKTGVIDWCSDDSGNFPRFLTTLLSPDEQKKWVQIQTNNPNNPAESQFRNALTITIDDPSSVTFTPPVPLEGEVQDPITNGERTDWFILIHMHLTEQLELPFADDDQFYDVMDNWFFQCTLLAGGCRTLFGPYGLPFPGPRILWPFDDPIPIFDGSGLAFWQAQ